MISITMGILGLIRDTIQRRSAPSVNLAKNIIASTTAGSPFCQRAFTSEWIFPELDLQRRTGIVKKMSYAQFFFL